MEETAQNLKETSADDVQPSLLICHICSNRYESPKILSCWHSFCLKCLKDYTPENSISLVCPLCFIPSVLPVSGLGHLPDNCLLASLQLENSTSNDLSTIKTLGGFIKPPQNLNNCESSQNLADKSELLISTSTLTNLEPPVNQRLMNDVSIEDGNVSSSDEKDLSFSNCQLDTASSSAIVMDDFPNTDASQSGNFSQSYRSSSVHSMDKLYCRLHERRSIELYCNQCHTVLCYSCSQLEHYGHNQMRLEEAVQKYRITLQSIESAVKENHQHLISNKELIEKTKQNLSINYNEAHKKCLESFEALQKTLHDRMTSCLNQLKSVYNERSQSFDEQIVKISECIATTQNEQDFLEKVLDSERSELILLAIKAFNCETDNNCETIKRMKLKTQQPVECSLLEFDTSDVTELENNCKHINGIVSEKLLCSDMISLSKLDLDKNCCVNNLTRISIILTLCEHENLISDAYKQKADRIIHATITSPNQQKIDVEVVSIDNAITNKNAVCYLKFTLQQPGIHFLEVLNYGISIRGSPFQIKAVQFPARSMLSNSSFSKTKHLVEQKKSFQNMSSKSNLPEKKLKPIKSTEMKTPPTSSKLHRSNSSLNRPPWNSSPNKTDQLRRTVSIGIVRSVPANAKLSNACLQIIKNRSRSFGEKQTPKFSSPRENRILNEKIDEEEFQIQGLSNFSIDSKANNMKINKTSPNLKYSTTCMPKTLLRGKQSNNISSIVPDHKILTRSRTAFASSSQKPIHSETKPSNLKLTAQKNKIEDNNGFMCFGSNGTQIGEFLNIQGVFFKDDHVYVTDSKNQCIQILQLHTGKFVKKLNLATLQLKLPPSPMGISVESTTKIYVADYENRCVIILDENGNYIKKLGYNHLLGPKGIILDSQANLMVVDNRGCCVQTYSATSGEFLFRFGIQGYRDEELCRPHFCALSSDEKFVIISDFRGDKVKVFTREGKFVKSFGANGLRGPTGLAVHKKSGNIVVCDFGNSKIQVYKSNGFYMYTIDTSINSLSGPQGVCFIDDDHILVADSGNHCLKVFRFRQ